jgi:hypothetical protein
MGGKGAAPPHDSGTAADLQSPGWTIGSGGGKEGVGASWHLPGWSREGEKEEGAWGGVRYGAPGGGGGGGGPVWHGAKAGGAQRPAWHVSGGGRWRSAVGARVGQLLGGLLGWPEMNFVVCI